MAYNKLWSIAATVSLITGLVCGQRGFEAPIVQRCPGLNNATNVACVRNYAAVLPYSFERASASNGSDPANDTFIDTSVPSDPSFGLLKNALFVVFDEQRGLDIIGSFPIVEKVFDAPPADSIHEAPVYVPELNAIIYSLPHQRIYQQQIINLNFTPPTLSNYTTSLPVYAVNGGKYFKGKVYWAVEASFSFPSPTDGSTIQQTPGIYMLDPLTGDVTTLLNNYYSQLFNSPNNLFIDSRGDVFFTDSWYGYAINVTVPPVLVTATYHFRPSTGATYNPLGGKAVYAFDVTFAPPGNYLTNKRPIWLAETFGDDGFHISREGYLLGAAGSGVDVLSEYGELIMRIEADVTINNLQFAGTKRDELWLFGMGGIFKVSGLGNVYGMVDE